LCGADYHFPFYSVKKFLRRCSGGARGADRNLLFLSGQGYAAAVLMIGPKRGV